MTASSTVRWYSHTVCWHGPLRSPSPSRPFSPRTCALPCPPRATNNTIESRVPATAATTMPLHASDHPPINQPIGPRLSTQQSTSISSQAIHVCTSGYTSQNTEAEPIDDQHGQDHLSTENHRPHCQASLELVLVSFVTSTVDACCPAHEILPPTWFTWERMNDIDPPVQDSPFPARVRSPASWPR